MDIHNGHLHAPYFIFVKSAPDDNRDANVLNDDALIKSLIVACQKPTQKGSLVPAQYDIYVTKTGDWIHIMDNWKYSLYHNSNVQSWVEDLGEKRELFICAAGEIDDSHEWFYYSGGNLQRSVAFQQNSAGILEKKVDVGIELPGEWKANLEEDVLDKVLSIAGSLGISMEQSEAEIWSYSFLNGKIVNTREVFKRQDKTAAERRQEVKVKRSGKQILVGLFALTLLIIFGGYHFFSEEALANRLAEEERLAFEALMDGPAGTEIRRTIYLEKIKNLVKEKKETAVEIYLDSIFQDSIPKELLSLSSIEELTIYASDSLDEKGERIYQLQSIDSKILGLENLKKLILENHNIGEIPESVGELKQLELLNLRGNGISTLIVEEAKGWIGDGCRIYY